MKYQFDIIINESGQIPKKVNEQIRDIFRQFSKKKIRFTIEKYYKQRSNLQNRWYWGVAVRMIAERLKESNPLKYAEITDESVHEWLKANFLEKRSINIAGIEKEVSGSTIELTTTEFMAYKEDIQRFAAEKLDLVIPDPNEDFGNKESEN